MKISVLSNKYSYNLSFSYFLTWLLVQTCTINYLCGRKLLKFSNFTYFLSITRYYTSNHSPQYPAMLHDLRLHVVESTPHSSSVKHLWSARASVMWQALSTCWLSLAGQTCKDIALARLACFSLCTNKNFITYMIQFHI